LRSAWKAISSGVRSETFPFPPTRTRSFLPSSAFFKAPQVTVVVPEECQSKPSTQEKAWNQKGSASLRRYSSLPSSSRMTSEMERASLTIRLNSQRGAVPVCRGRSEMPVRGIRDFTTAEGISLSDGLP